MSEVLDGAFIKVPYETLKRETRDRKYLLDDISRALSQLSDDPAGLEGLQLKLEELKQKAAELDVAERADLQRLRARLEHQLSLGVPRPEHALEWERSRIDRLIVDYLLRAGYQKSALELANATDSLALSDAHIFEPARAIVEGLERRSCAAAIAWCADNAARLSKLRSTLPFQLRRQEFVELVRAGRRAEAIAYARRHLARWAGTQLPEIRAAAGLLAFARPGARCAAHAALLAGRALARPGRPLPSGLAALNASLGADAPRSRADPLRLPAFAALAAALPRAKHSNSQLICALSHDLMDEDNAPLVLPNGYVYGERALRQQAALDEGHVTCPVTGLRCPFSLLKRAYIS
ncbi:hypothetical protein QBZ16_001015 [Prototheca wickerhamii]|uniref:Macrophage erythroblast attacher n=1 Tax=Prototheca wickerhamii TaxID=3111 RepID=A0AAD9IE10_PROWI|nr:hypothetical protein QBZ16_001015 [Prototheca wickerhamii]